MTLQELANENGYTLASLSRALGIGPSYLSQINTGRRKPGVRICKRIEEVTEGCITIRDLRPEGFKRKK